MSAETIDPPQVSGDGGAGDKTEPFLFSEFEGLPSELPRPRSIVAFDTETSQLHPDDGATVSVISVAWLDETGEMWGAAFPFGQGPDDGEQFDLGRREWDACLQWLADAPQGLVGHNSKFDILQLANRAKPGYPGRNLTGYVRYDSMVAAREFWAKQSAALKDIAVRLFEEDANAEQLALKPYLGPKKDMRYDRVPWDVMKPYAIQDAILTLRTYMVQQPLWDEGYYGSQFLGTELAISNALARMELAGIPYPPDDSLAAAAELKQRMAQLSAELPFDPTPNKSKAYYFGAPEEVDLGHGPVTPLALPPYKRTPGGDISLTADVLDQMVRDKVPYAEKLQELNRYKSAVSKWYEPFANAVGKDGRLRTSFRQVASGAGDAGGTRSGRFSAGRVNLQAIPKDFHVHLPVPTPRQLISRAVRDLEGWSLYELDLAQAELRVAALDANCRTMLEIVRDGRDPHGETATQLFNTPPDHPDFKFNRQVAKRANFSLIFGAGPKTFRDMILREAGVALSMHQSSEIVYGWRDLYPEYGVAIAKYEDFIRGTGYVRLMNGKRRYYQQYESRHSGFNQVIQGSLAEYGKRWLLATDRLLYPLRELGVRQGIGRGGLVLVIHDSQVLLLPDESAEEICNSVRESGLRIWRAMFPGVKGDIDISAWDGEE